MSDPRPIGVFDSGVGGLTLAHSLANSLPNEDIIFFGDTAHLPYGDKSAQSIKHYSEKIFSFLKDEGCKTIIIACNTASSIAFNYLDKKFGKETPIVNVIDPVVAYCLNTLKASRIGVIGTKGTIRSRAYPKKFHEFNKNVKVTSASTPLLAPMIEEGFYNNNISQTIINAYLSKKQFKGIQAMVLACTHYPLIKKEIEAFYKGKVEVVDNTDATVSYTKQMLSDHELLNTKKPGSTKPGHEFFVSDYTKAFEQTAKLFFGKSIRLKRRNIWE